MLQPLSLSGRGLFASFLAPRDWCNAYAGISRSSPYSGTAALSYNHTRATLGVIRVPIPAMPFSSYRDGCGMVSNVHGLGPVAGWSAFRVHRVRAGNV